VCATSWPSEVGLVRQYFFGGHPRGQQSHDHLDRVPQTAHRGFTVADLRVDGDPDQQTHAMTGTTRI
jgi:hypothetical protein